MSELHSSRRRRILKQSNKLYSQAATARREGEQLRVKSVELLYQAGELYAESNRLFIEQARIPSLMESRMPSDSELWEFAVVQMDVNIIRR